MIWKGFCIWCKESLKMSCVFAIQWIHEIQIHTCFSRLCDPSVSVLSGFRWNATTIKSIRNKKMFEPPANRLFQIINKICMHSFGPVVCKVLCLETFLAQFSTYSLMQSLAHSQPCMSIFCVLLLPLMLESPGPQHYNSLFHLTPACVQNMHRPLPSASISCPFIGLKTLTYIPGVFCELTSKPYLIAK